MGETIVFIDGGALACFQRWHREKESLLVKSAVPFAL